jgi:Ala-tRNA(Pro) deacylase
MSRRKENVNASKVEVTLGGGERGICSHVTHIPARSAPYAASLLHVPGGQVAKTVALRAGKQILLAVLPASYHLNLEKLATTLGTPVNLTEERECYDLFPDCQPGTVPPFGELYNLPVYMDRSLAAAREIIFSAGTLCESIRMSSDECYARSLRSVNQ